MADINRAAVADMLIPKFAGFLYDNLRGSMVLTKAGFVDYSTELKDQGEQVKVSIPGEFTLEKKSVDADVSVQDSSISTDFLTLDSYVPLDFVVRDVSKVLTNEDLIKPLAESAAQSYARFIERDFGNVFDANYYLGRGTILATNASKAIVGSGTLFTQLKSGYTIKTAGGQVRIIDVITDDTHLTVTENVTTLETDVAFSISQTVFYANNAKIGDASIRSARTILSTNGVEDNSRVLVCNPDDYNDLLDDTHYKDKDSINAAVLRDGSLGRIRSLDTYESNNFNKAYSVAFAPSAVGCAFRAYNAVPDTLADSKIITDPVSKIPLRITMTWDPNRRGTRISIDLLYGVKLFQAKKVVKILQSA